MGFTILQFVTNTARLVTLDYRLGLTLVDYRIKWASPYYRLSRVKHSKTMF